VPSAKHPPAKPAATIVNATAKTRSVIEDLQARLTGDARAGIPAQPASHDLDQQESVEDLERQLQAYFEQATPSSSTTRSAMLDELRSRVIDGVVDRILNQWAGASPGAGLSREVMDRLIERVLEEFRKTAQ
jgi:hypothetical protein